MKTHDSFLLGVIRYYPSRHMYDLAGYLTYTLDNPQKVESYLRAYYPIWLEKDQPAHFSTHWQDYYLPFDAFVEQYGEDYYYGYYRGTQYAIAMGTFDAHFGNPLHDVSSYDGDIPYFGGYVAGFKTAYRMAYEAHLYRNPFLVDIERET